MILISMPISSNILLFNKHNPSSINSSKTMVHTIIYTFQHAQSIHFFMLPFLDSMSWGVSFLFASNPHDVKESKTVLMKCNFFEGNFGFQILIFTLSKMYLEIKSLKQMSWVCLGDLIVPDCWCLFILNVYNILIKIWMSNHLTYETDQIIKVVIKGGDKT